MPQGTFIMNKRMKRKRPSKPLKRAGFTPRKRRALTAKMYQVAKRVVMKRAEPKSKIQLGGKTEVYHNTVYQWLLNDYTNMPVMGAAQNQRVGDQINISGWKLRMVLGQKSTRANVTWKFWIVKVPKGSTYNYNDWFRNIVSNVLLDPINTDYVKVLKSWTWKPYTGYIHGGTAAEITYPYMSWIPYRKQLKFGPSDNSTSHNDDDVYLMGAAYDAWGTLLTDNIGYVGLSTVMHYRDP